MNADLRELKHLDATIASLKKQRAALIEKNTSLCNHPLESILETPYTKDRWGRVTDYDWRVCTDCGLAEEGWGCGYKHLASNVYSGIPRVDRETFCQHVRKRIHQARNYDD